MSFGYIPAGGGGSAELPPDLEARLLPTGGENGQIVVYSDDPDQQGAWGDLPPMTKFRGEWGPDELAVLLDFSSGSIAPAVAVATAGTVPTVVVAGMGTHLGASKPPLGQLLSITTTHGTGNAFSGAEIDLALLPQLAGKVATRVKFYDSVYHKVTSNNGVSEYRENGVAKYTGGAGVSNGTDAWAAREFALVGNSKLAFGIKNASSSTTGNAYYVAGIEVYATPLPYQATDVVAKDGKLWKSKVNNNSATPAAGSAFWTPL